MGIFRTAESRRLHIQDLYSPSRKTAPVCKYGKQEEKKTWREMDRKLYQEENEEKLVCVTSGISYLGLALVNQLLSRGYSVRIAVDNQGELAKVKEMNFDGVSAVMAKMTDIESLYQAFQGCRGVFHTSAFIDPAGVTGYTKYMAELEMKASENVIKACAMTGSVRKCVFTSSLLACVWRSDSDFPDIIDHNSWSNESLCIEKKLWCALGKTIAEKAAWRVAKEKDMKLATICPGLTTGPEFYLKSPTPSTAYMKGAQNMYTKGALATVHVDRVAEAHICVYEALNSTASGRYICFDRVIEQETEVLDLATQVGLQMHRRESRNVTELTSRVRLCNEKLSRLMSRQLHCN